MTKEHLAELKRRATNILKCLPDSEGYPLGLVIEDLFKELEQLSLIPCTFNNLYHISKSNLDGITLYPRIPSNDAVFDGNENDSIPRICFSPFIEGCLQATTGSPLCQKFNIYVPTETPIRQFIPSIYDVKDQPLTGEVWVCEPVTLKFYGTLKVHARVDTAPSKSYVRPGGEVVEVSNFNYTVQAVSNADSSIIVVDEEYGDIKNDPNRPKPQDYPQRIFNPREDKYEYITPAPFEWPKESQALDYWTPIRNKDGKVTLKEQYILLETIGCYQIYIHTKYPEIINITRDNHFNLCYASNFSSVEEAKQYLKDNNLIFTEKTNLFK